MPHLSDGAKYCASSAQPCSDRLSGTAARHELEGRQNYLAPGTIVVAIPHFSTYHRSKDTGGQSQQHSGNTANRNTSCLASRQGTASAVSIVVTAVVIVVGLQETTARGARIAHSSITALCLSSNSSQDYAKRTPPKKGMPRSMRMRSYVSVNSILSFAWTPLSHTLLGSSVMLLRA